MNFDPEEMMILREEAEKTLRESLSEDDQEHLMEIRNAFSNVIKWKELSKVVLQEMHELLGGVITDGSHTLLPITTTPLESLTDNDQEYISGRDYQVELRKEYVSNLLLLKLVGSLKSILKKRVSEVQFLDPDQESELLSFLGDSLEEEKEEVEGDPIQADDHISCPGCYERYYFDEYSAGTTLTCNCGLRLHIPETEEERELDLVAQIQGSTSGCRHEMTRTRVIPANGKKNLSSLHTFCTRCNKTLETKVVSSGKKKNKACSCSAAEWIPGKEGKEARCSRCKKDIKDPGRFRWEEVGLEPYGDDPSKDEVILL